MIKACKEKLKSCGLAVIIIAIALVGCGPRESGNWYDSESDLPPRPLPAKPKTVKKAESEPREPGRVVQIWSRVREALDRRPEAQKQKQNAKSRSSTQKTANGLIVVQKGDTYYSLSQTHKVPLRALLESNDARPPYVLSPGARVSLPTQAFYEVRKKDTLYSISRSHKTDVATLAKLNGLSKPFTISVGQRLQIPGLRIEAQVTSPEADQPRRAAAAPKKIPPAPKRVGRFLVPVKGAIISSFGPKDGGLHNDGINIAASEGAPIRAAENGVVVYTGNELRGYGNLLLIRHSEGWITAYAHTSKFLVKPGARVKQGDVVAEVGRTGNVERPQLHFELRKGTRAVNPQSLI